MVSHCHINTKAGTQRQSIKMSTGKCQSSAEFTFVHAEQKNIVKISKSLRGKNIDPSCQRWRRIYNSKNYFQRERGKATKSGTWYFWQNVKCNIYKNGTKKNTMEWKRMAGNQKVSWKRLIQRQQSTKQKRCHDNKSMVWIKNTEDKLDTWLYLNYYLTITPAALRYLRLWKQGSLHYIVCLRFSPF